MERGTDNWAYVISRKIKCCVFYEYEYNP